MRFFVPAIVLFGGATRAQGTVCDSPCKVVLSLVVDTDGRADTTTIKLSP